MCCFHLPVLNYLQPFTIKHREKYRQNILKSNLDSRVKRNERVCSVVQCSVEQWCRKKVTIAGGGGHNPAPKGERSISRYGAGIEHLRQHFFRSSYPCQLVTRLRCVYRGARMLTGNTCAMHQVLKFLLAKWLFKVICYSFTL